MKIEYIKSVLAFINEDSNLSSIENNQEWKEFLENLDKLVIKLEEYYTPNKEGEYKALNEEGKNELNGFFIEAIKSTDAYLKNDLDLEEGSIEKVRHQLVQNINVEFLSKAYVEFQNAEVRNDKSLKEMMDNFRNRVVPMTNDQIKMLGGNLNSRINLNIEIDGEKVNGVFTPNVFYDLDKERNNLINDMIFRYPKYKEYFEHLNNNESIHQYGMVSTDGAIVNGEINHNFYRELTDYVQIDDRLLEEFFDDDEFFNANIELTRKAKLFVINENLNSVTLGLTKGDNIDKRNSAMSGIAHMLEKDNLLAKSRPIVIEMTENGNKKYISGTFMDYAKGKDLNNLPAVDKAREAKSENFNTVSAKKSLANLQIIDYICGNVDRHRGNMFYQFDPETNNLISVQGIDNDASFFRGEVKMDDILVQFAGVNRLRAIDSEMALRVLALKEETFKATLLGYELKKAEIDAAWHRTELLQQAIKKGITYENVEKLKSSVESQTPYITIFKDEDWEKVDLKVLGENSKNLFDTVSAIPSGLSSTAKENTDLLNIKNEKEVAFNSKLRIGNEFINEAKAAKPLFCTSVRYQNILQGLGRYQRAESEEEKLYYIDDLEKFVEIYKSEKIRDGVLDKNGNLLQNLTGKDLARVNLVKRIDNYVKVVKIMHEERDTARKKYEDNLKKVDEINATYRRGKYHNYAKCYKNEEGKILVDREILKRDETVDRDMVNLTNKMINTSYLADTSNNIDVSNQKREEYEALKEYRDETVSNLKSQLLTEYNYGRIPKEYYDYRLYLLNNNIFGENISEFAAEDPNSPIFANAFDKKLQKDVDDNFIDDKIDQNDINLENDNELDNKSN